MNVNDILFPAPRYIMVSYGRDSIFIFSSYIVTLLTATLCPPLLMTSMVTVPVSSIMNTWGSRDTFVTMTCAAALCCSCADIGEMQTRRSARITTNSRKALIIRLRQESGRLRSGHREYR
ncbi:MAG: hypothetical protein A4E42_01947 [Methanoregulaceae archaeon PtaU1.Bin222]|nr:MAG: hypothetical protein A4E42_01947 [Methanoregulaceae archaeon PtaU1.Bin222]